MTQQKLKVGMLRVWRVPQVPGKPFHVYVTSLAEAKRVLDTLAEYDLFQFKHNIKPDYCAACGLEVYEADAGEGEPGWSEWCDADGNSIDSLERV